MEIKMRPRKFRQVVATFLVSFSLTIVLGLIFIIRAHADGTLSVPERAYADNGAAQAVCQIFDREGVTVKVVVEVGQAVASVGDITLDNAADVINYSVQAYCPVHWQKLVEIGNAARAASQQSKGTIA